MLRVAVIGGGPSGSCSAEILAKAGIKTWIFERKLDNAKPCEERFHCAWFLNLIFLNQLLIEKSGT